MVREGSILVFSDYAVCGGRIFAYVWLPFDIKSYNSIAFTLCKYPEGILENPSLPNNELCCEWS
jgi:hypothetical protein